MSSNTFFVTGAQRSGTTLLDRLLSAQPAVSMLSQPFPLLFIDVKRAFLETAGGNREHYPLGHLFRNLQYASGDFDRYLAEWRTTHDHLAFVFHAMRGYSGQYTRFEAAPVAAAIAAVTDDAGFPAVFSTLVEMLARREDAAVFGSKETTCEEFVPALLACGVRCVMIVRDPRDVLASLNHGRGPEFAGDAKPTLFNVRSWRKSVATVLAMEGRDGFQWCRYEDLVADPERELRRIVAGLGLAPGEVRITDELRSADGAVWTGNSSHRSFTGVGSGSVNTYRDVLPPGVARFVEAATLPELRTLGYEWTLDGADATRVLETFADPYPIVRPHLSGDLTSPDNAAAEIERLQRVNRDADDESPEWFVFRRAHERLREAMQ